MKKASLLISAFYLSICLSFGQDFFNSANSFFEANVKAGKVGYSAVKENPEKLNALVSQISKYNLTSAEESEIKAFYINAYNILVIKGVVDKYPINSPLDVEGFFDKLKYKVADEMLTLNGIENEKIRAEFNDPKIHFALVCAAEGCPKILPEAYFPSELNRQLRKKTTEELNDPVFIRLENSDNKVEVSEIFKWYEKDFGGREKVISFINKYRKTAIPEDYKLDYYEYDWSLNEKK